MKTIALNRASLFRDYLRLEYKGSGDIDKRAKVRDFLHLFGIDVVAMQESKLCSPMFAVLRSIRGLKLMNGRSLIPLISLGAYY